MFTSQTFLHNLILCSICLIFSRVKYCKHACIHVISRVKNLNVDCSFQRLKILTRGIQSTMCLQGKFPDTMQFTPLFSVSARSWRITRTVNLTWACHRTEKCWEAIKQRWLEMHYSREKRYQRTKIWKLIKYATTNLRRNFIRQNYCNSAH